ncbi:unnamed protein product [Cylindrotheca closterium]|uniref:Fungal lipase-type domain-containing protein n=1 Tax=Cylindrotheca closterium TaxID=2856 RepID=A0AAD2GCP2_9STRA|nr:unnamed protein product [Cylindrotheca closterium]
MASASENDPLLSEKKADSSPEEFMLSFEDHFSLETPSDNVRLRNNSVRVYSSGTQQFQIISTKNELKAKVTSDGSSGLSMLRGWYTLIAVLMMGFLLIFCLQVLLFLFVSLVMEGGLSSNQKLNVFHLVGAVLSIPYFVYGLASTLTMGSEFVLDTWNGHKFFRSILRWSPVFIDWFSFFAFLGIPLIVMITRMFQSPTFWEDTALAWFGCVTVYFCLFSFGVFVFEIWGALELLSHHPKYALLDLNIGAVREFARRAIMLRMQHAYSGLRTRTFFVEGGQALPTANESYEETENVDTEFVITTISLWTRFSQWLPDKFFFEYDPPKRQFNIEDVLDREYFVTDATWSLEKAFCRRSKARSVMVVNGESALTSAQVWSSLICACVGYILIVVLFAGFLAFNGANTIVILVLTGLFIFFNRDKGLNAYKLFDSYKDTLRRRDPESNDSETLYQITESHRLTRPSDKICWILFGCEIFFLLIFPFWMLCDIGNGPIAKLFVLLGLFSACRHYLNVPVVLTELGNLDLLDGKFIRGRDTEEPSAEDKLEDWLEKNRLSKIVARISQGARKDTWSNIIGGMVTIFFLLFLAAFGAGSNNGAEADTSNLLHDFEYKPLENTFKYPTCSLTSNFALPGSNETALADYTFLAGVAYNAPESMPGLLDAWFGEDVAQDNHEFVTEYRSGLAVDSAVHYKLITFPTLNPEFAIVDIRGTNNGWDMISDAQLWSAAWLAQAVRAILPLGAIWSPIIDNVVAMIGVLQTETLRKVAFYVQTSDFVDHLKEKGMFKELRVTGHSLGGGLAMITGAQTETPAVALSGPNTIITRHTLEPEVSLDSLEKYTFNIIPDRDPVPAIDDPSKNYQRINCLAAPSRFADCHTATRSLCDILYTCGSGNRPVLCECVAFGYPEPEPTGDRTFRTACKEFL